MEENNNATDTNVGRIENSIEENIELLQDETSSLGLFFKCKGSEKYRIALEHILSDYKRVLKENEQLRTEVNSLKKDISNMYDEEVIISIISDNFNLSRNEVLKLLGGE